MTHADANPPCETFARVIGRLSAEIQRLTREIPLHQGRLQELESLPQPDDVVVQGLAQVIQAAVDELQDAEKDIVQMEILFRTNCHRGTA